MGFLTTWCQAASPRFISFLITRMRATRALILFLLMLKSREDPTRPGIVTFWSWTRTGASSMKRGPPILSLTEAGRQDQERSLIFDRMRCDQADGLLQMRQDFLCFPDSCAMMRWLRGKFVMPSVSRPRERGKLMSGLLAIMLPALTALNYPPMGQRFRLKADFDVSRFSTQVQVILRALKTYGMILADNGSAWYLSGVPDPRWNNDVLLSELKLVKGSDFEAVDVSSLMLDPDSGEAKQPSPPQEPPPSPSGLKVSFWHWLTARKVDCSSGVCTFK